MDACRINRDPTRKSRLFNQNTIEASDARFIDSLEALLCVEHLTFRNSCPPKTRLIGYIYERFRFVGGEQ